GQRTDQFAALSAVQRTENQALRFREQGLERTEDRSACGASRRSEDRKPSAQVQRTEIREDRGQIRLRRFAPFRGQKTKRSGSEDRD
ncbi:MAG: hypothetical protein LBD06_08820, partial [Candidatus Accumulibacter sp.]|nr:hypothetical protein [Accumulibacter sp.]